MTNPKPLLIQPVMKLGVVLSALLFPLSVQGAVTITKTFNVSALIPDNNDVGYSSTYTVAAGQDGFPAAADISSITSVTVDLNFTGGYNGDLYVYLVHGNTGFAILLNRIGRSASNSDGSASSGMTINLDDTALNDIHSVAAAPGEFLTGSYRPDGRITDPDNVLTSDPRTALLSSFTGLSAVGDWQLFVADVSAGEQSTLQSWTLRITAVPEPTVPLLLNAFAAMALFRRRRA